MSDSPFWLYAVIIGLHCEGIPARERNGKKKKKKPAGFHQVAGMGEWLKTDLSLCLNFWAPFQ